MFNLYSVTQQSMVTRPKYQVTPMFALGCPQVAPKVGEDKNKEILYRSWNLSVLMKQKHNISDL